MAKNVVLPIRKPKCPLCFLTPAIFGCIITPVGNTCATRRYVTSIYKAFLVVALLILLSTIALTYIYVIITYSQSRFVRLQLITEWILCLKAIILISCSLAKTKTKLLELNGWNWLFHSPRAFGLHQILTCDDLHHIRRHGIAHRVLVWVLTLLFVFFLFAVLETDSFRWFVFRKFSTSLSVFVQLIAVFQVCMQCVFVRTIFNRYFQLIVGFLEGSTASHFEITHVGDCDVSNVSLVRQLRALSRFYSAVMLNLGYLVDYMNPALLLWFLCILSVLIINIYLLIVSTSLKIHTDSIVALEIETISIIIGVIYQLNVVESACNVSEDILSFLFRYPISKLNAAEAAQVEMMITTLQIQKPILRASDIFTVGTRLLASISGTVVTYVLVALQFHASWTK